MRNHRMFLILVLSFVSKSFPQSYGLGNTDPSVFSRFKIPETDLRSIWIASNLSYRSDRFSAFASGWNQTNTFLLSAVRPSYYLVNETDDRYFLLNSSIGGVYRRSYQKNYTPGVAQEYYFDEKIFETDLHLNGVYRSYTGPGETFTSLASDLSVQLNESVRDQFLGNDDNRYMGQKQQSYLVSMGIGLGKMRNVTAVVSALRFQERLKQLNVIDNDLGDRTIEALAEQFYQQGYYGQVHDRPDKHFWQEVGKTLSNEGVLLEGINQYGQSYLRETPGELRFQRNEGAVGGVGLQFSYNNRYNSDSSPKIVEQFFALANVFVDYSHQLNLNSQFAVSLSVSGGPNMTKNPAVRQMYAATARLGYAYELTDQIVTTVDNRATLSFFNGRRQGRELTNTFGAAVSYFVEDHLSLTGSYSWMFFDTRYALSAGHEERIFNDVQVGLTYYVWRGFMQGAM